MSLVFVAGLGPTGRGFHIAPGGGGSTATVVTVATVVEAVAEGRGSRRGLC